jgi:hypothetical protein
VKSCWEANIARQDVYNELYRESRQELSWNTVHAVEMHGHTFY